MSKRRKSNHTDNPAGQERVEYDKQTYITRDTEKQINKHLPSGNTLRKLLRRNTSR